MGLGVAGCVDTEGLHPDAVGDVGGGLDRREVKMGRHAGVGKGRGDGYGGERLPGVVDAGEEAVGGAVGGASGEQTGEEAGESEGSYFEETAGGARTRLSGFQGWHEQCSKVWHVWQTQSRGRDTTRQ